MSSAEKVPEERRAPMSSTKMTREQRRFAPSRPNKTKSKKDPFRQVDAMLAAFARAEGFRPNTFVGYAQPVSVGEDDRIDGGVITRSFRFELDGHRTIINVHGREGSKYRRDTVRALEGAGYDPWLSFDDGT
jgi:hypothetical protein